jgi:hypothetical protein
MLRRNSANFCRNPDRESPAGCSIGRSLAIRAEIATVMAFGDWLAYQISVHLLCRRYNP